MRACAEGHLEIANALLMRGASTNIVEQVGIAVVLVVSSYFPTNAVVNVFRDDDYDEYAFLLSLLFLLLLLLMMMW